MNGLPHILSISTTFIPTSFTLHLLYPVFLLKKAKLYGLPEPFCLCLRSAKDRQLWDFIRQKIYALGPLPVKPGLVEAPFLS